MTERYLLVAARIRQELAERLGHFFNQLRAELLNFADFLEQAGRDGGGGKNDISCE